MAWRLCRSVVLPHETMEPVLDAFTNSHPPRGRPERLAVITGSFHIFPDRRWASLRLGTNARLPPKWHVCLSVCSLRCARRLPRATSTRRSLRGAAQRSSGDDHVGLSFQNQRSPREPASTSSLPQPEVGASPRLERQAKSFSLHGGTFFLRWFLCSSSSLTMPGRIRGRGTSLCPVSQVVARRQGATSFFGFLPSGPTRSLDATDHRLG